MDEQEIDQTVSENEKIGDLGDTLTNKNPLDNVFPLQIESKIEVEKYPNDILQINLLFDYYNKKLALDGKQIKDYNIKDEFLGLSTFLTILENQIRQRIYLYTRQDSNFAFEPQHTISLIYPASGSALNIDWRKFSDRERAAFIYDSATIQVFKGDEVIFPPKQFIDSAGKITDLNIVQFDLANVIKPSTLSMVFNIRNIVDKIILNKLDDVSLPQQCGGGESELAKFYDNLLYAVSGFGFDSAKKTDLDIQDFLNAYIHPIQELERAPKFNGVCNDSAKQQLLFLRLRKAYYENAPKSRGSIAGLTALEQAEYNEIKIEIAEIIKACPDLERQNKLKIFEGLEQLDDLAKLFSEFFNKFNLECFINEVFKCILPQIPCEEIFKDITIDNFESRLNTAFPYLGGTIKLVSKEIRKKYEDAVGELATVGSIATGATVGTTDIPAGNLTPEFARQSSKKLIDSINSLIDIEALCNLDLGAIIKFIQSIQQALEGLLSFNMFDWRFEFMIDFNYEMLRNITQSLIQMLNNFINELVNCGIIDSLLTAAAGDTTLFDQNPLLQTLTGNPKFLLDKVDTAWNEFYTNIAPKLSQIIIYQGRASQAQGAAEVQFGGTAGITATPEQTGLTSNGIIDVEIGGPLGEAVTDWVLENTVGVNTNFDFALGAGIPTGQRGGAPGSISPNAGLYAYAGFESSRQRGAIGGATSINSFNNAYNQLQSGLEPRQTTNLQQALSAETESVSIFKSFKVRDKNKHIIEALAILNQREKNLSVFVTQETLAEQLKGYLKTCFSVLSPGEILDLLSNSSSTEVKVTAVAICKIRYPLLFSILKYPDVLASLFASFGRISQLDAIGPTLRRLAAEPKIKNKLITSDTNICAPYSSIYDFRKALMNNALPEDLANDVINNLIEDDRIRANKFLDLMAGKNPLNIPKSRTEPDLRINKTHDGKPIQEIDEAVDNTLDSILDQIKIAFDEDMESFPAATEATNEVTEQVKEFIDQQITPIYGFNPPSNTFQGSVNQEFIQIKNIAGDNGLITPEDNKLSPYYNKKVHKKQTGKLFKDIFSSYDLKVETGFLEGSLIKDTSKIDNIFKISTVGSLEQSDDLNRFRIAPKSSLFDSATNPTKFLQDLKELETPVPPQDPKWILNYEEKDNGKFKFVIKTIGDIKVNFGPKVKFAEKLVFSGSMIQPQSLLEQLITDIGLTTKTVEPCDNSIIPSRFEVFEHILNPQLSRITDFTSDTPVLSQISKNVESKLILDKLFYQNFITQDFTDSKLLKEVKVSQEYSLGSPKTIMLNLIDFSPITDDINCDTHLLQLEATKKRIKQQFESKPPENIINRDSRINTRYSDGKPGPLSKPIMTGLADTFIRTSVIHNILKGLFIFDKFDYKIGAFSYEHLIYLFIESRVKKDILDTELQQDFEQEYDIIYDWYVKEELISKNTGGSKFYNIVKYHVDSVLEFLDKLINGSKESQELDNLICELNTNNLRNINYDKTNIGFNTKLTLQTKPQNLVNTNKNLQFLNNLEIKHTFSHFYKFIFNPDLVALPKYDDSFNFSDSMIGELTEEDTGNKIIVELEKYIYLDFKDEAPEHLEPEIKQLFNNIIKKDVFFNKVVNLRYFTNMYNYLESQLEMLRRLEHGNKPSGQKPEGKKIVLFTDNQQEAKFNWLKNPPKFGLRLVLKKITNPSLNYINEEGFLPTYNFQNNTIKTLNNSLNSQIIKQNNKNFKIGEIQSLHVYKTDPTTNEKTVKIKADVSVIPLLEKELEIKHPIYSKIFEKLQPNNLQPNLKEGRVGYIDSIYTKYLPDLKQMMISDSVFTLLVNYCLQTNMTNTLALFNSMIGMNNEGMYRLFGKTKDLIKDNFIAHRDSGKFKDIPKINQYRKHKKSKQDGPPPIDFLKAAATIPIGLLKGISVAVDPNIFLADKIVLAGKMGFIQPRYKRFEEGEELPVKGKENEKAKAAEGIATDKAYVLEDGIYKALENPQEGGTPLLDYTPVALVKEQNKKQVLDKDDEGKNKIRYGTGFSGIPWDAKTDSAADSGFDEEDIDIFEIRPSLPIYPGESINIPYKVASLALMPFPVFTTTPLTTYNIAMPFGPLFLALEDLLAQDPQTKYSIPKPIKTDQNLKKAQCEDKKEYE